MKRITKIGQILLVLLLTSSFAMAQVSKFSTLKNSNASLRDASKKIEALTTKDMIPHVMAPSQNPQNTDNVWDVLFSFPLSVANGGEQGVETDGTYIYTTMWSTDGNIRKYSTTGTLLETFSIPGVGAGLRDLAYDGTYFYGGMNAGTVYKMDFVNHTLVGTFTTSATVRHCSFDPLANGGAGGLWVGSYSDIKLISLTGAVLTTVTAALPVIYMYGSAYDGNTTGGPYLWFFCQDGSGVDIYKFTIATLTMGATPEHSATDIPGYVSGDPAGGCASSSTLVPGKFVLLVNIQAGPNIVGCYDMGSTAPTGAPAAPTGFTVTPGANGALTAALAWTNPSTTVGGAALTSLTAMEIYRDNVLVNTISNPTIGGAGSWTDAAVPAAGSHEYKLVPINATGNGLPATQTAWIGPDVPAAPTNVVLAAVGATGSLTWTAPTTGLHSGYFTGVTGYDIVRNPGGVTVATNWNGTQPYVDNTIPSIGTYSYAVTAKNASGAGGTGTSNTATLGGGNFLLFEDFTSGMPAGWTQIGLGGTNWMSNAGNVAGGTAPELMFSWSPSFVGESHYTSPVVNSSGNSSLHFSFKMNVDWYSTSFTVGVQTTSDGGATWHAAWDTLCTGAIPSIIVSRNFTNPDVGSPNLQFAFWFSGDSFEINYWYIDDLVLEPGAPALGDDVGVTALVAPVTGGNLGANEAVTITVRNFGTNAQSNIPVAYKINGGTAVTGTLAGPLAGGATANYTFTTTANLSAFSTYNFDCYTSMTGDQNAANDHFTAAVTHTQFNTCDTLHYDGANNDAIGLTSGGTFYVAARYPAAMMAPVVGGYFDYVKIFINDMPTTCVLKIWAGGTTAPGTQIYSQDVTSQIVGYSWNQLTISPSPQITNQDYWVGYSVTHAAGQYPAGMDAGPADANGDWISTDGTTWQHLAALGYAYNWNIRAAACPDPVGTTEIPGNSSSLLVFPNPASTQLNVMAPDQVSNVQIVNHLGQIVLENTVNAKVFDVNTSSLKTGIYFLRMETAKGLLTQKVSIK